MSFAKVYYSFCFHVYCTFISFEFTLAATTTTTTTTTVAPTIDPNKIHGMQISRSAFIPPPPMEPPSTTPASTGPSKLNCPTLNGLFPYEGDCNKFINCWKGRPHVQTCAAGTLFNSATSECDHASKVVCYGKMNKNTHLFSHFDPTFPSSVPSVAAEIKPEVPFFDVHLSSHRNLNHPKYLWHQIVGKECDCAVVQVPGKVTWRVVEEKTNPGVMFAMHKAVGR